VSIDDILGRLEEAEREFIGREFLTPVIPRGRTVVRIAGVFCELRKIRDLPEAYRGWAVLKALSTHHAEFVRPATLSQTHSYLQLLPRVRLILLDPRGKDWLCIPAHRGDGRFSIDGPVTLQLPEPGLERFETVLARFDGRLFWYQGRDPGRNPAIAAYLREQLLAAEAGAVPPDPAELHRPGLTPEEREAYGLVMGRRAEKLQDQTESRLKGALRHSGARYLSYYERDNTYVVRYQIDGQEHVSRVSTEDLTVLTSGICLAGQDERFDLTSLVGVLREANETGRIYWMGDPDG
jgi:hypothetical protein